MVKSHIVLILSITLIVSCRQIHEDDQRKTGQLKTIIAQHLQDNQKNADTLECQASINDNIRACRDLVVSLNRIITVFADTSKNSIPSSSTDLTSKVSDFNIKYQRTVDSVLNAVGHNTFLANDLQQIKSTTFKPSTKNDNDLNYFLTCVDVLEQHRKVVEINKGFFSHDPCRPD